MKYIEDRCQQKKEKEMMCPRANHSEFGQHRRNLQYFVSRYS
jgi:hypothetical protein